MPAHNRLANRQINRQATHVWDWPTSRSIDSQVANMHATIQANKQTCCGVLGCHYCSMGLFNGLFYVFANTSTDRRHAPWLVLILHSSSLMQLNDKQN